MNKIIKSIDVISKKRIPLELVNLIAEYAYNPYQNMYDKVLKRLKLKLKFRAKYKFYTLTKEFYSRKRLGYTEILRCIHRGIHRIKSVTKFVYKTLPYRLEYYL